MSVAVTTILDEIEARLGNITTANEYNVTAKKIVRGQLTPFKGYDLPSINFWPTNLTNTSELYGSDIRDLTLFIEIHNKTHDDPFSTVAEKLAADIVVALNRATSAPKVSDSESLDFGGTISNLIFNGYDYEIGEGQAPWCGALLNFTIRYRADLFNMSTYTV